MFTLNRLIKTNSSDTEAPFLDLNVTISNDTISTKNMINGTISILMSLIFRS